MAWMRVGPYVPPMTPFDVAKQMVFRYGPDAHQHAICTAAEYSREHPQREFWWQVAAYLPKHAEETEYV